MSRHARPDEPVRDSLPAGAVFWARRRWWRAGKLSWVNNLVVPRGHERITSVGSYADKVGRTARARECGCYICRDLLATPGWAAPDPAGYLDKILTWPNPFVTADR